MRRPSALTVPPFVLVGLLLLIGCGSASTSSPAVTATATAGELTRPTPAPVPTGGTLDLNPPNGYTFNGGGTVSTSGTLMLGSNCTIRGVNFTGGMFGIKIRGSGNRVSGCTFGAYSWAALVLSVGNDNVLDGNTFNGMTGFGANIQVLGGKRNQMTDNVIHGGITAIVFLYSRSYNDGGLASLIEDNVVSGNTCSGFSEEGISFDVFGNSPANIATLETDHIQRVSGSAVTLSPRAFPSYVGYDMVFLSGALAGRTRSIAGQSRATFMLDFPATGAAVGDQVVIGATFKRNLVSGNTVVASDYPGVILYGMAFGNRIENNIVLGGGIKVESIDNLAVAAGSATKSYGRAPCGYNTVENNVVTGGISLEYHAIPDMNGHLDSYPPYVSVGNNVVGNSCARIAANDQNCYISGNTGLSNYSNVTLNPVEMQ